MTSARSLEALSRDLGIEIRYSGQSGETRQAPESTARALVARLRPPPDQAVLPPVLVQRHGDRPLTVPLGRAATPVERLRWQIETASGDRLDGTIGDDPAEITIEESLPLGCHCLRLLPSHGGPAIAECRLIVAPSRAFLPSPLRDGGRLWGLAVQLFALRSPRNWGIGDFTDLADLIDRAATCGAGAIGLNPVHALFPEEPERTSPYSPSSRDFLNVLYLDPEAISDFAECEKARRLRQSPEFEGVLSRLRAATLVDYAGVAAAKLKVLDLLYRHFADRHLSPMDERGRTFRQFQS